MFSVSSENSCCTETHRKPRSPLAFLASPELSRNLVLTTSKEIVIKAMKGFEYILAKLQVGIVLIHLLRQQKRPKRKKKRKGHWQLQKRPRTWPTGLPPSSHSRGNCVSHQPLPSPHWRGLAPCLRALAALSENQHSLPSNLMVACNHL